jgi:CheY-like chemotaxis protein
MITKEAMEKKIKVLLVEDNPGDVRLTLEALKEGKVHDVSVVGDGREALAFLNQEGPYVNTPCPNLILLDLNLPKKDGREVLREIKNHQRLKHIPVVALTTSSTEGDILRAYELHANCYITKPVDFVQFANVIKSIEDFWLTVVKLPQN